MNYPQDVYEALRQVALAYGVPKLALQMGAAPGTIYNKINMNYNCSTAQKAAGCAHRRLRADKFDEWLLDHILTKILTPQRMLDVISEVETLGSEWESNLELRVQATKAELKKIKHTQDKIMEVIETHGAAAPRLGTLLTKLDDLALQEEKLNRTLHELSSNEELEPISKVDVLQATNILGDIIKTCEDPKRVRTLLQYFVEKIVLNNDSIDFYYRPEKLLRNENSCEHMVHSYESWLPDLGSNQGHTD